DLEIREVADHLQRGPLSFDGPGQDLLAAHAGDRLAQDHRTSRILFDQSGQRHGPPASFAASRLSADLSHTECGTTGGAEPRLAVARARRGHRPVEREM